MSNEIKRQMAAREFECRIDSLIRRFMQNYSQNKEKANSSSPRDLQMELTTWLALQSFVRSVQKIRLEEDTLSRTAILYFTIVPTCPLLKCTEPLEMRVGIESASETFGKGFSDDNNSFGDTFEDD